MPWAAFVASAMAILIERPMRRSSLAFYVANVATETLFRIAVARGLIKAVNNGQVYIFTISMAVIMMLAKKNGFEDDPLSTAIRMVVGAEEACPKRSRRQRQSTSDDDICSNNNETTASLLCNQQTNSETDSSGDGVEGGRQLETIVVDHRNYDRSNIFIRIKDTIVTILNAQHKLCPHKHLGSCVYYIFRSCIRSFLIGYLGQLSLKLLTRSYVIVKNPSMILTLATQRSVLNLGLFLSTFTTLYKMTNCTLRWTTDTSNAMNCFISSLVAGPAMLIYPSSTISLYVMWKCLEVTSP